MKRIVYFLTLILVIIACRKEESKTKILNITKPQSKIKVSNEIEGTWFNSEYLSFIRKSKSICSVLEIIKSYPLISLNLNYDTLNYFCAGFTEGATSRLIIDSTFANGTLSCIRVNDQNSTEFCYQNNKLQLKDNLIPVNSEYLKISNSYKNQDSLLQGLFSKELFDGKYIDLTSKDTVVISKNKIYFSNNSSFNFKIGLEFISISVDYVEISEENSISHEFYNFTWKDNKLILKHMELQQENDTYTITEKKIYKFLKLRMD